MVKKVTNKEETEANVKDMWEEVSQLPIQLFSLANQKVGDHTAKVSGTFDSLLLTIKSPAVLPALEETLKIYSAFYNEDGLRKAYPKFVMEQAEKYIIIKRGFPPIVENTQNLGEFFISKK